MDTLFDVFNSSKKYDSKPFKCAMKDGSLHFEFLKEMKEYFGRLLKETRQGFSRPPCFQAWQLNISALLLLWDDLKREGYFYLRTRLISQDPLENLFGVIRSMGATNVNPTACQFRDFFKKAMISDVLGLRSPEGGNCESDQAKYLFDLACILRGNKPSPEVPASTVHVRDEEITRMRIPEVTPTMSDQNIAYYVAGVCAKKFVDLCKDHLDCTCVHAIAQTEPNFEKHHQLFSYCKAYSSFGSDFGALTIPSDNFARLVDEWNKIFLQEFDKNVEKPNLISSMIEKVVQSIHCCIPWFPSSDACRGKLRTILSYFLRIRVYYVCKTMNERLVDQKKMKENRKYRTLQNL